MHEPEHTQSGVVVKSDEVFSLPGGGGRVSSGERASVRAGDPDLEVREVWEGRAGHDGASAAGAEPLASAVVCLRRQLRRRR